MSALISGDVQFIATGGSVVAAASAQGAPVVMVATLGSIAYKLMAHPSISSVKELKGKVIGALRPGTTTDFVLLRILQKVGLVPGKDVTILPTGLSRSDERLLLMFQGKIHATIGTVDNVSQLELKGLKVNVLADPVIWESRLPPVTSPQHANFWSATAIGRRLFSEPFAKRSGSEEMIKKWPFALTVNI